MKDEDKLIAEIGEVEAREEIARLQMAFDTCTDIDPNADSIDSQVATKVMGWQYCDRRKAGWGPGPTVWLTQSAYSPTFQDFAPSKSISDAWRVVKAMDLYLMLWKDDGGWTARFYNFFMVEETADTAEKAICRAALAAVAAKSINSAPTGREGEAR
jgi:hypothetical protein